LSIDGLHNLAILGAAFGLGTAQYPIAKARRGEFRARGGRRGGRFTRRLRQGRRRKQKTQQQAQACDVEVTRAWPYWRLCRALYQNLKPFVTLSIRWINKKR
jgi:hypothetical protein